MNTESCLSCQPDSNGAVGRGAPEDAVVLESWLRRQYVRTLVYCNTAMLMPDESGTGKDDGGCCLLTTQTNRLLCVL